MNTMQRQIKLPAKVSKEIMEELGMPQGTFSLAMNFKRSGEDSKLARELALERGGVVYCYLPECETIHDANGLMVQTFPNGARLIIDKSTSEARIEHKGELVSIHYHVTIHSLTRLQQLASSL